MTNAVDYASKPTVSSPADPQTSLLSQYGAALLATGLAIATRAALHPLIGNKGPFAIFFLVITYTAWQGSIGPAVLSLLLGASAALLLFVPPVSPTHSPIEDYWSLGIFLFTGLGMIWMGVARRRAQGRALANATQALQHEQYLTRVLEGMTDGFVVLDRQWRYAYVNDRAAQIVRRPREQLLGRNIWEEFPENVNALGYRELHRAMREQVPVHYESFLQLAQTWIEVHAYPAPQGLSIFFADVTERRRTDQALRESESRNRAILQAAFDGIITVDQNGIIESLNPAAQRLFGYEAGEAIGKPFSMLLPVENDLPNPDPNLLGTPREVHGRRKSGTIFPMDLSVNEVAVGEKRMFIGLIHDITERKTAEQQREGLLAIERTARSDAERASRLKDEFLATVSHELRTPLNAILGWAQLLRTGDGDADDLRQGIETIERNARSQAQLVDDLLDMSRITSGRMRLEISRLSLREVIEAAIESVKPAAAAKEIDLHQQFDPTVPQISGDASRLQQIAWNLLSNAIKFTPRGGRVMVSVRPGAGHVQFSVSDSGIGIKPDFMDHLFQRFRQADASMTRRHAGLGLGLSICRHLVELHGGTLIAHSEGEGKGSTFSVELPVSTALHSSQPAQRDGEPEPPPDRINLAGIKVLVVDDELDSRELVKRWLCAAAAQVWAAASAAEAMQLIHSDPPHVLISDIGMPDEDGYSLLRRLRALPASQGGSIPALALTAFARVEDRTRALLSGYQAHLSKPVEAEELVANVASLAGRAAL